MTNNSIFAPGAQPSPMTFDDARRQYEMAKADMEDAKPDMEEDCVLTLYCNSATEAADALLMMPAPDIFALFYKLEVSLDVEAYRRDDEGVRAYMNVLISDAHRLAGEPRS